MDLQQQFDAIVTTHATRAHLNQVFFNSLIRDLRSRLGAAVCRKLAPLRQGPSLVHDFRCITGIRAVGERSGIVAGLVCSFVE